MKQPYMNVTQTVQKLAMKENRLHFYIISTLESIFYIKIVNFYSFLYAHVPCILFIRVTF